MKNLLTFDYNRLRAIPMGILGALGVFFLVMMLDTLVTGLFYATVMNVVNESSYIGSITVNIGIWVTKLVVLILVYRITTEVGLPTLPSPFKNHLETRHIKQMVWLALGLVLFFRLAFDSQLGLVVVDQYGIDEELVESMKVILGAPLLGLIYIDLIGPVFEEIIYRGILFGGMLRKGHRFETSALVSSLLFALMHLNVAQGVNAFFLGLALAYVYHRTGNLMAPIVVHVLNNVYVTFSAAFTGIIVIEKIPMLARLGLTGIGIIGIIYLLKRYGNKADSLDSAAPSL